MEILIVEDSMTQAIQLQYILEKNGYKGIIKGNGRDALAYLEHNKPTIILSDVVMPEMDGYAFCRKVKSSDNLKDIPFILITTLSEPEDIVKGLDCGANNFITKPYEEEFLLSRLKYILINRELRKDISTEVGIEIFFAGKKHFLNSDRMQILDLLLTTYENAVQKSRELERVNKELKNALETIKTLGGLLPICSHCKKIRNDDGYWEQIETYIRQHSDVKFTHGICPDCVSRYYADYMK